MEALSETVSSWKGERGSDEASGSGDGCSGCLLFEGGDGDTVSSGGAARRRGSGRAGVCFLREQGGRKGDGDTVSSGGAARRRGSGRAGVCFLREQGGRKGDGDTVSSGGAARRRGSGRAGVCFLREQGGREGDGDTVSSSEGERREGVGGCVRGKRRHTSPSPPREAGSGETVAGREGVGGGGEERDHSEETMMRI